MSKSEGGFHILALGDSLTFQGPQGIVSPRDGRLFPQVVAQQVAEACQRDVTVDLSAREGWTARDAWWALTKDPIVFSEYLPRADAVLLCVGGMDQLPAVIPTYLRDSMPYIRSGSLRRKVRRAYRNSAPFIVSKTGGLMRQLPQQATDRYLTRIVQAVRAIRGDIPILAMTPSPYGGDTYPSQKFHLAARAAMLSWGAAEGVCTVDIENIVSQSRQLGESNPDGMHWGWATHQAVGQELAVVLAREVRCRD
jgi:diglucosylglycerate octanoyltransferase